MAISNIEAEYVPIYTSAREAIWLKKFSKTGGVDANVAIILHGDDQTSLQMEREAMLTEASKHIAISCHLIRDPIGHGITRMQYVPTKENPAEPLKKGLRQGTHWKLTVEIGIDLRTTEYGVPLLTSDGLWKALDFQAIYVRKIAH